MTGIDPRTEREYWSLAWAAASAIKDRDDRADAVGAANLEIYSFLETQAPVDRVHRHGFVARLARWGVMHWLRTAENPRRTHTRHGLPLPQLLPLDWFMEEGRQLPDGLVRPDFAGQVVDRVFLLDCYRMIGEAFGQVDADIIAEWLGGTTAVEIGAKHGWSKVAAHRHLKKLRAFLQARFMESSQ